MSASSRWRMRKPARSSSSIRERRGPQALQRAFLRAGAATGERPSRRGRRYLAAADRFALHARRCSDSSKLASAGAYEIDSVRARHACAAQHAARGRVALAPPASPLPQRCAAEDIRDIRGPKAIAAVLAVPGAGRVARCAARASAAMPLWRWTRARQLAAAHCCRSRSRCSAWRTSGALMQPGSAREFSIAVSDIVRNYIEAAFNVTATHRTTEEFLHDLLRLARNRSARRASRICWRSSCSSATSSNSPGMSLDDADHGIAVPERPQLRDRDPNRPATARPRGGP